MIPQMTAVADLTRSEGELSLKPGYAVGVYREVYTTPSSMSVRDQQVAVEGVLRRKSAFDHGLVVQQL